MTLATVDHPATLPRHALEAEVVYLRERHEVHLAFLRYIVQAKFIDEEVRMASKRILNGGEM